MCEQQCGHLPLEHPARLLPRAANQVHEHGAALVLVPAAAIIALLNDAAHTTPRTYGGAPDPLVAIATHILGGCDG